MASRHRAAAVVVATTLCATFAGVGVAGASGSGILGGLARPHAKFVSGTATGSTYYAKSHVYVASYSTERSDNSGRYPANSVSGYDIPKAAYPHGYQVSLKGGYVVSGTDDEELLIASGRHAQTVHLTVRPASVLR